MVPTGGAGQCLGHLWLSQLELPRASSDLVGGSWDTPPTTTTTENDPAPESAALSARDPGLSYTPRPTRTGAGRAKILPSTKNCNQYID